MNPSILWEKTMQDSKKFSFGEMLTKDSLSYTGKCPCSFQKRKKYVNSMKESIILQISVR
jgi:hypothetical protein